jgi:iron-sulfur cluster repair protein YtfE (RIC family)
MVNIYDIMARDHDVILKLLNEFNYCMDQDNQIQKKAFEKFLWEIEKHIFTEEKVVFTLYNPENLEEGYKMIPQLMKEHDIINKRLNEMRKNIYTGKPCDSQGFKDILIKHKDFEERSLYPILDEELDEKDKEMIINRINEIKITGGSIKNVKIQCSECGEKIGYFKGYHHSKLEKKWILCSKCYDRIELVKQ